MRRSTSRGAGRRSISRSGAACRTARRGRARSAVDGRARIRAVRLAATLGVGPVGPLERDAATRGVLDALDNDLDTAAAIRGLERAARSTNDGAKRSLRYVAQRILGVI